MRSLPEGVINVRAMPNTHLCLPSSLALSCDRPRALTRVVPRGVSLGALLTTLMLGALGCESCVQQPTVDAGVDAGTPPPTDSGTDPDPTPSPDGGQTPEGDAGPICGPQLPGYGEPCAAQMGDPECGQFLCDPQTDALFCYDLGPNDCGGCDELDESAGRVGEACGEFGCGIVVCGEDGTATVCEGDHPRNQCGGCADITPAEQQPGDVCSICGTGVQTCTRDQNDMVCYQGRAPDNVCGGCDRCVLFHAFMDERFGGGYIRNGTIAIIEDIGGGETILTFDPLIEGAGTNGLVLAQVMFATSEDPINDGFFPLTPGFAEALNDLGADPVRQFQVPVSANPAGYRYVVLYDFFLQQVISLGELRSGPPPIGIRPDAGPVTDGGAPSTDGGPGTPATDAGPGTPATDAGPGTPTTDGGPGTPPATDAGPGTPATDGGPGTPSTSDGGG